MMDVLAAAAWQQGDPPALVEQLINLSVTAGVPTAYTCTVGFETTPKQWQQMQATPRALRRQKIVQWVVKGALGVGVVGGVSAAMAVGTMMLEAPIAAAIAASGGSALPAGVPGGAGETVAAGCMGCEGGCSDGCVVS
jgi:hypothetical protein